MFFLHDVWLLFIGGSFKKSEFVVTKSINHWSVVVLLREGGDEEDIEKLVRGSSNNNKIYPEFIPEG